MHHPGKSPGGAGGWQCLPWAKRLSGCARFPLHKEAKIISKVPGSINNFSLIFNTWSHSSQKATTTPRSGVICQLLSGAFLKSFRHENMDDLDTTVKNRVTFQSSAIRFGKTGDQSLCKEAQLAHLVLLPVQRWGNKNFHQLLNKIFCKARGIEILYTYSRSRRKWWTLKSSPLVCNSCKQHGMGMDFFSVLPQYALFC